MILRLHLVACDANTLTERSTAVSTHYKHRIATAAQLGFRCLFELREYISLVAIALRLLLRFQILKIPTRLSSQSHDPRCS